MKHGSCCFALAVALCWLGCGADKSHRRESLDSGCGASRCGDAGPGPADAGLSALDAAYAVDSAVPVRDAGAVVGDGSTPENHDAGSNMSVDAATPADAGAPST